jgi:hypothetical protein
MNYGEKLAYWYFRLNGFFPISNFVIHRSLSTVYPSDCDILAIRPPNVYEEIGGHPEDWDEILTSKLRLDFSRTLGIICEVKTGGFKSNELFDEQNINYAVDRLGFAHHSSEASVRMKYELQKQACYSPDNASYQIAKILIAHGEARANEIHLFISLKHLRDFIKQRLSNYWGRMDSMDTKVR